MSALSNAFNQYIQAHYAQKYVIAEYKKDTTEEAHMMRVAAAQAVYLSKLQYAKAFHGAHFNELWNRFQQANEAWTRYSYRNRYETRQYVKECIRLGRIRNQLEEEVFYTPITLS
jgi:hypothetical protein